MLIQGKKTLKFYDRRISTRPKGCRRIERKFTVISSSNRNDPFSNQFDDEIESEHEENIIDTEGDRERQKKFEDINQSHVFWGIDRCNKMHEEKSSKKHHPDLSPKNFINLREGAVWDRYKRLGLLGCGSYGSVYKVIHLSSGKTRALKVINRYTKLCHHN